MTLLGSQRLVLRSPCDDDSAAISRYYARNDGRFSRWAPPRAYDEPTILREIEDARSRTGRLGFETWFFGFERATRQLVTEVRLDGFSTQPIASAMIAYSVDVAYERRGIASEAVRAVIAYAFETLGLHQLSAHYDPANTRSERLLQRLDFTLVPAIAQIPGLEHLMRSNATALLVR